MYSSYKKQQKLHEGWRSYLKEEVAPEASPTPSGAPAITSVHSDIEDYKKRKCKWNYEGSNGMKVFFDVTSFSHENQTLFGKAIILGNAIQKTLKGQIKGAMGAANHVGFIFSDGSIFHATSDKAGPGVSFQTSIKDMVDNPHQYVILDLGGDEGKLKKVCQDILQELSNKIDPAQAYDKRGIARQIPLIGKLLAHLPVAREENEYSYYCSELVANALVRAGFMTAEQLQSRMLNEQLGAIDELSPTELYELIAPKSKVTNVVCELDKAPQAQAPQAQAPQAQAPQAQAPQARVAKPERFFESKK